jgi:hypothetical protein
VDDRRLKVLASIGLGVGGVLGMAGTFAPSVSLRGLAWGIDGVGLVMAGAILTVLFYRTGHDLVAAGFLVFAIGEGTIMSSAAMDLNSSGPSFGAGSGLWAMGLALISLPPVFPFLVRTLGLIAASMFASTALQIFSGIPLTPLSSPLPLFAYPCFVATFAGWIWTLLKVDGPLIRGK